MMEKCQRDILRKRVNRRLAHRGERIILHRKKEQAELGEARVIDINTLACVRARVTLDAIARELGIVNDAALAAVAGA